MLRTQTTDDLVDVAHAWGICVYWRPLKRGARGLWQESTRSIWLDPRLSDMEARSLLGHELGHAALGHDGPQDPPGERAAWEWAAALLVDPLDYMVAERDHGPHTGALAEALDLKAEVITAFQTALALGRAAA